MDVNEAIVKTLESIGVDHVYGGSGQVNGSMLLALKKSGKIKTVIIRNEQAASFMACGYAMFSDKLGVCFSTGGPGAFNLFSGMAVAYSDSLPVLGITGYVSAGIKGKGALNESSGLSRTPDSHKMFSLTTKKSFIIEKAEDTCDILEEAINLAYDGRPGPVHIHVPKDITIAPVPNFRPIRLNIKPVRPDPEKIRKMAEDLAQAMAKKEPVMAWIGYGCIRSHAEKEILHFLETFQIPFVTTMDAKGIVPEDHALSLGVLGTSGDPGAKKYFEQAKLILAVGNSFAENATYSFKKDLMNGKTLMHINIDPHEIGKVYPADHALVSDVRPAIVALQDALSLKVKSVEPAAVEKDKYWDKALPSDGKAIHPGRLVQALSKNLPENAIVMGDAGSHMLWLNCYLHLTKNQRYQNPGSFGPMASHVNGAIGVKCANPDKTVVCGCGDGAYLMAGFELLTAVQNDIPVIWIIFKNGEFNVIRKFLLNLFGEEAFMQFKNPDYVKYAQACGADGYRVEKLEEFDGVFQKALASNRPALIDVAVDPDVFPPFSLAKV
ncbi:MAG: thiamine pyrophosphate-binding protein [Elusimicrobia bacterium]|nr:thiamine pyrophosphate-binding protein [Elusimicrobiota bacterium]